MKTCDACGANYRAAVDPDPCLGYLPGVAHACCGHGDYGNAYVVIGGTPGQDCRTIENQVTLYGLPALEFFDLIKMAQDSTVRDMVMACPTPFRSNEMVFYPEQCMPQSERYPGPGSDRLGS